MFLIPKREITMESYPCFYQADGCFKSTHMEPTKYPIPTVLWVHLVTNAVLCFVEFSFLKSATVIGNDPVAETIGNKETCICQHKGVIPKSIVHRLEMSIAEEDKRRSCASIPLEDDDLLP